MTESPLFEDFTMRIERVTLLYGFNASGRSLLLRVLYSIARERVPRQLGDNPRGVYELATPYGTVRVSGPRLTGSLRGVVVLRSSSDTVATLLGIDRELHGADSGILEELVSTANNAIAVFAEMLANAIDERVDVNTIIPYEIVSGVDDYVVVDSRTARQVSSNVSYPVLEALLIIRTIAVAAAMYNARAALIVAEEPEGASMYLLSALGFALGKMLQRVKRDVRVVVKVNHPDIMYGLWASGFNDIVTYLAIGYAKPKIVEKPPGRIVLSVSKALSSASRSGGRDGQ